MLKWQKLGHTSLACNAGINICRKCSKHHFSKECTANVRKCVLGKCGHYASSLKCPKNPANNDFMGNKNKESTKNFPTINNENFPLLHPTNVNISSSSN